MLLSHPMRDRVVQEMLLRRFPSIEPPVRIFQILRLVDLHERDDEMSRVRSLPGASDMHVGEGARHIAARLTNGGQMTWERHSEASTATLLLPWDADSGEALSWLEGLPGRVMRATRVIVAAAEDEAITAPAIARMAGEDLVTCLIGPCRLWSDFRIGEDGYGRIVLAANGCSPGDLGRLVQRVQELGNYRNLALLGLPVAQQHSPALDRLEGALSSHARTIAESDGADEALLDLLSQSSAELAHVSASTAFRMGATRAYAAIAADRLAILDAKAVAGHQSLADFTERRLIPAVRTCENFAARLETLDARTSRVTALLRTRIETRIELQNRDLLRSVERSIGVQLQMQSLVEGLSVLAISYYAIALLGHLLEGVGESVHGFPTVFATSVAVLPVTLAIFLVVRHHRRRLIRQVHDAPPAASERPGSGRRHMSA